MTEPTTPRQIAQAVNTLAGIPDDAHEEALTRLIATGARSGWNSLTQADFDQAQDAFDDATGHPRRKHMNPTLWKIRFWWHWHVTSPILYPAMDAPGDLARLLKRPFARLRRYTGYGWGCPPCRIWAGDPTNAFVAETDAAAGLAAHLHDSHGGIVPDGADVGEITWRGDPRT